MRALAALCLCILTLPALADDAHHVEACASAHRVMEEKPDSFRLLAGFAEKAHGEGLRTAVRYTVERGLESPARMVLQTECHFENDILVRIQKFGPLWYKPEDDDFKFMRAAALTALKNIRAGKAVN